MPILWRASLPVVVDRANALCRSGMFAAAHEHYLLGAELARIAELPALETKALEAAACCDDLVAGIEPEARV